jgi:putative hemolysin
LLTLNLLALLALALASYLAALNMALMGLSRLSLQHRMEERDLVEQGRWLADRLDSAVSMTALLRTAMRLAFFAIVLVAIVGLHEETRFTLAAVTFADVAWAGALSVVLLWLFTSVLAGAIARYSGVALIAGSMHVVHVMTIAGLPLRWVIRVVDEMVKRLSGANMRQEDEIEAQLLRSIEETHLQGGLDEDAATLLENVVEFGSTDVGEVMTPRTDIKGIELTDDLVTIRRHIIEAGHSRIPVYRENLDNIAGILYVKDLVPYLGQEVEDFKLEPLLRKPIVIPETKPVRELLADFQKSEVHMAIVIDEYGGTAGLATIEDVLEEIVGEIHDEHEAAAASGAEPALTRTDESLAEVDGRFRIDELNEELELDLPEEEEYDTVAGFLLAKFGRVPEAGETVESNGAKFTVLAATATHIQKVGIELLEPELAKTNGRSNGSDAVK